VTDGIKKGADFDWIRSAGWSCHYQVIEDGIVRGVIGYRFLGGVSESVNE
jgi:hypothetical protein